MNLPNIEITIDGVTYDNTFSHDVTIDRTNLEEEIAEHAQKYYYYAFLSEVAKTKAAFKKIEMEQCYATLDHEKRDAAKNISGFKFTEKMCENEVITDQRYRTAQTAYLTADLLANQLEKAERAMSQRKDMLIQLGNINRHVMSPSPRVTEQQTSVAEELISRTRGGQLPPSTQDPAWPALKVETGRVFAVQSPPSMPSQSIIGTCAQATTPALASFGAAVETAADVKTAAVETPVAVRARRTPVGR